MKFLCTGCQRLDEVERFRLDGPVLIVTCTQCNTENRAGHSGPAESTAPSDAAAPAGPPSKPVLVKSVTTLRTPTVEVIERAAKASSQPFTVPEGRCPKCISKRPNGMSACPNCGLVYSQADVASFAPDEWVEGEWRALLAAWGDDKRHEMLRSAALMKGELAAVGRLYRLRLAESPDDPWATRGRDEVLRLAVLPTATAQKSSEASQPMWKYVALSSVIVACLIALFYLVRQMLATA